jgi:hypothetical protein
MMKDHVYEGRGGVKFVRIEPGSILQLLYPCSRYSPDSCLFCGGSFEDHMTLKWAKQLYTPFDRYLDAVRERCVITPPPTVDTTSNNRKSSKQRNTVVPLSKPLFPKHVFHRLYVQDTDVVPTKKKNAGRQIWSSKPQKQRDKVFYRQCEHVRYQIPFREVTLLRAIALAAVEALIRLERIEDRDVQRRWNKEHHHGPCC